MTQGVQAMRRYKVLSKIAMAIRAMATLVFIAAVVMAGVVVFLVAEAMELLWPDDTGEGAE